MSNNNLTKGATMKNLIIIFVLVTIPALAQVKMTPDGYVGGITLRVNYNFGFGNLDYIADKTTHGTINREHPELKLQLLFPAATWATVGFNYERQRHDEHFTPKNLLYKHYSVMGVVHKIGVDLFIYIKLD